MLPKTGSPWLALEKTYRPGGAFRKSTKNRLPRESSGGPWSWPVAARYSSAAGESESGPKDRGW